jgi:hypothetical protein
MAQAHAVFSSFICMLFFQGFKCYLYAILVQFEPCWYIENIYIVSAKNIHKYIGSMKQAYFLF